MTAGPAERPLHRRLRSLRRVYGAAAGAVFIITGMVPAYGWGVPLFGLTASAGLLLAGRLHAARLRRTAAPADPDQAFLDGLRKLLANDRFGAEAVFREMTARNPADVEATFYLGLVLREHGDLRGSARLLARALRIDLARAWTREIRELLEAVP